MDRSKEFTNVNTLCCYFNSVSLWAPATWDTYISLPFPDIMNPPKGLWAFKAL